MRIIPAWVLILFLLTACSGDETVSPIHKMDEGKATASAEDEADLTVPETDEKEEFIEFTVDEEVVSISIRDIPILHEYLQVQKNPQKRISEMTLRKYEAGLQAFFLLRFACHQEHCSYLLLHPEKDKPASLIADMASLVDVSLSPDESKAAFHFNRLGERDVPASNIIVFDLYNWIPAGLENGQESDKLGYAWPIMEIEWLDNESLAIHYPDLLEPSTDALEAWHATEENAKTTIIYQLTSN